MLFIKYGKTRNRQYIGSNFRAAAPSRRVPVRLAKHSGPFGSYHLANVFDLEYSLFNLPADDSTSCLVAPD
jgi:hypothetical protein